MQKVSTGVMVVMLESTPLNIGSQRTQVGTQKFRNHVNSLWKEMTNFTMQIKRKLYAQNSTGLKVIFEMRKYNYYP